MRTAVLVGILVLLSGAGEVHAFAQVRARRSAGRGGENVEKRQLAGLDVAVWRPSTTAAPAPLVVFSHGYHGCNTQSIFLMEALAQAGYLVLAPNHKDAFCSGGIFTKAEEPFTKPSAWTDATYDDRAADIKRLLEALKGDKEFASRVDWSRIGLAGHSLGGYTVVGLAGGWPKWKLPPVKAVLALSPYCDPFAMHGALGTVGIPIMYQGGTRDIGITPTVKRLGEGCYAKTSSPAYFVEFNKAGHFAWTNLVPQYQTAINHYSIAFFDRFLRGDTKADLTKRIAEVSDLRSK